MDSVRLNVLRAEVDDQLNRIEQVFAELEDRANLLTADTPANIESVAYQLHNVYSAIEDLMQIVAKAFENSISDLARWHTQLLNRMALEIEGVRPALLAADTTALLHELRAFRHFFRHAYGVPLDFSRVEQNLLGARQLRPLISRDVATFLNTLGGTSPGDKE